jgi:hypothetical protein
MVCNQAGMRVRHIEERGTLGRPSHGSRLEPRRFKGKEYSEEATAGRRTFCIKANHLEMRMEAQQRFSIRRLQRKRHNVKENHVTDLLVFVESDGGAKRQKTARCAMKGDIRTSLCALSVHGKRQRVQGKRWQRIYLHSPEQDDQENGSDNLGWRLLWYKEEAVLALHYNDPPRLPSISSYNNTSALLCLSLTTPMLSQTVMKCTCLLGTASISLAPQGSGRI